MLSPETNRNGGSKTTNLIFDLDGTLVDSLPGIEESARAAIQRVLPYVDIPDLRALIGPPIAQIFGQLWPELPQHRIFALVSAFREHYDGGGCLNSTPYPHVREVLPRLQKAGRMLFVLTNKPERPATKILQHLGLSRCFTAILGSDSVSPPFKRKADGALFLAKSYGLLPHLTAVVGDGADDAESAEICGFRFIAAAYGYGGGGHYRRLPPTATLHSITEIEDVV